MSLSHALLHAVTQPSTGAGTPHSTRDQKDCEKSREAACPPNSPTLLASAHPIPSAPPSELPYPSPQLSRDSPALPETTQAGKVQVGCLPTLPSYFAILLPLSPSPPPSYCLAPASTLPEPKQARSPGMLPACQTQPFSHCLGIPRPYLQSCALLIVLPQAQSGVETPCSTRDQTDWEKFSPHRPGSQRGRRKQGTKQPSNKGKLRNQYLDL